MIQRNIRVWCLVRTWDWFKLYGRVKPMLKAGKEAEEMEKLNDKIKNLEDTLLKEEGNRKELETQVNHFTFSSICLKLTLIQGHLVIMHTNINTIIIITITICYLFQCYRLSESSLLQQKLNQSIKFNLGLFWIQ